MVTIFDQSASAVKPEKKNVGRTKRSHKPSPGFQPMPHYNIMAWMIPIDFHFLFVYILVKDSKIQIWMGINECEISPRSDV